MDSARIKFFDAKNTLLKQGYTNTEIANALYEFSYDGIPNEPKEDPNAIVRRYYAENAAEGKIIAKHLLREQKKGEYTKIAAYALASRYAPGMHARSYYSGVAASYAGFPIFTAIFLTVIAAIVAIKYDLPQFVMYIPFVLVSIYFITTELVGRIHK